MTKIKDCIHCLCEPKIKETKHYTRIYCECGRSVTAPQDFRADAFDDWDRINMSEIELLQLAAAQVTNSISAYKMAIDVFRDHIFNKPEATK